MLLLQLVILLANFKGIILVSSKPKLLVISYDGFRYDYFERNSTPFMRKMKEEGTDVDHVINIFVTKTFPNHHTITTGFYAETHGVVDSNYLSRENTVINISQEMYEYNKNLLPIWTLNQLNESDRHSGAMMWPGSAYKYNGTLPTYVGAFNLTRSWQDRMEEVLSWFLNPVKPANFVVLYIEDPDFHSHALGTQHPKINQLLNKLDNFTEYVYKKLEDNNLEEVNVIHLSDHGMADVSYSQIINLSSIIDPQNDAKILVTLSTAMIEPYKGKREMIYAKLKEESLKTSGFDVYRRENIPKEWHYGNNKRISSIFAIAKVGYAFEELLNSFKYYEKTFNISINNQSEFGVHGYDNKDFRMHPMFFARGPAFVSRCKLKPFDSVDLFPLFCYILNIYCQKTNGTLDSFKKCLQLPQSENKSSYIYLGVLCAVIICGILCFIAYFYLQQRRHQVELNYRMILNGTKMELWDD